MLTHELHHPLLIGQSIVSKCSQLSDYPPPPSI